MQFVVVLSDGETWTEISGCKILIFADSVDLTRLSELHLSDEPTEPMMSIPIDFLLKQYLRKEPT